MKKGFQSFSFLLTLTVLMGMVTWAGRLNAQDTTPQTQQPMPETQQPPQQQPPAQSPDQAQPPADQTAPSQSAPSSSTPSSSPKPEASAQTDANGGQNFTGTVVKQGDKYVLQDAASGTTYDIDHQDEVKKFEGKKVRVHGTLDSTGKMIHVQ
jgi:hypothetical protein